MVLVLIPRCMIPKVKKVVFPVGGLGTRFLPATKSMPKEMLPVVNKPLIHYAFEEARAAGIEQFIFVTGRNKGAIADHFDHVYELQNVLSAKDKKFELEQTSSWLPEAGNILFTRQQEPLGLGHAVWCARHLVGDEPFAVILADDLVKSSVPCLKQMVDTYSKTGGHMLAVMDVPREQTSSYGILDLDPSTSSSETIVRARSLVEKPRPENAPSTLSVIGRYILSPQIFDVLSHQKAGAGGEIQLTDAISSMAGKTPTYGFRFNGKRYDCGSVSGYVAANVDYALQDLDLQPQLKKEIESIMKGMP